MSRTTVGSQLATKYAFTMFMKFAAQISDVAAARPLAKSCPIGTPGARDSGTTKRVAPSIAAAGAIRLSHFEISRVSLRRSARNCSDSGNHAYMGRSRNSGTTPPTIHTDRQPS